MSQDHNIDGKFFATYHFEETYRVGPHDTIEECREEAEREFAEYPTILIGKLVQWKPSIDMDRALEDEGEQAYSECGECAEDYLNTIPKDHLVELENDVNNLFKNWLLKHGHWPRFGTIEDSKEFENRQYKPEAENE